jgi:hypothetical protein
MDSCGSCRVAGHYQRFNAMSFDKKVCDGMGATQHVGVIALAVRRMAIVCDVHKTFLRQFDLQGA